MSLLENVGLQSATPTANIAPTSLVLGNTEPERAVRVDSASFWTTTIHDATTADRHTNAAAGTADSNAGKSMPYEMAQDDKHAGLSKDLARSTSKRTASFVIKTSMKELRYLIQVELKPAIEAVQRDEMGSMPQNLVEENARTMFIMGHCAESECIKNGPFLIL